MLDSCSSYLAAVSCSKQCSLVGRRVEPLVPSATCTSVVLSLQIVTALPTVKAVLRGSRVLAILAGSPNVTLRVLGASKLLEFNHGRVVFISEQPISHNAHS